MQKIVIAILWSLSAGFLFAQQTDITKANECFEKKDWGCAQDYYARALANKTFKEGEQHILEFRIGYAQQQLKQHDLAMARYRASIQLKNTYLYPWWYGGNILFDTGQYDSAVYYYQKAIPLVTNAEDIELLRFYLGESYFKAGKYRLAINTIAQVKSREGRYHKVDAYIAEGYYKLGQYDSGLIAMKNAYKVVDNKQPVYKAMLLVHAQIYRNLRKLDSAEGLLKQALQIDPSYGVAYWDMGLVQDNRKNFDGAIEWYQKALPFYSKDTANNYILQNNIVKTALLVNKPDLAITTLQRMLPITKVYPADMYRLASMQYGLQKNATAAATTCNQLIAHINLRPDSNAHKMNKANAWAILGKIAMEKKDTLQALKHLQEAIRLHSANQLANLWMGDIFWNQQKKEASLKCYAQPPNYGWDSLVLTRADWARLMGRRALATYERNPNDLVTVKLQVENALQLDSLQKEAVQLWPTAIIKDYTLRTKRDACMRLQLRAAQHYAADKPYASELYNNHAVLADTKGDTVAVLTSLKKALATYNQNFKAWENLLKFYNTRGRFAEGAAEADKLIAIVKSKNDQASLATAMLYKGDFLWKLGKKEAAKGIYAEAQVYAPGNKDIENRLKMQ